MVQILGGQLIFNHVVTKQALHSGINTGASICKRRHGQGQGQAQKGRAERQMWRRAWLSLTLEMEIEKSSEAAIFLNILHLLGITKTQESPDN